MNRPEINNPTSRRSFVDGCVAEKSNASLAAASFSQFELPLEVGFDPKEQLRLATLLRLHAVEQLNVVIGLLRETYGESAQPKLLWSKLSGEFWRNLSQACMFLTFDCNRYQWNYRNSLKNPSEKELLLIEARLVLQTVIDNVPADASCVPNIKRFLSESEKAYQNAASRVGVTATGSKKDKHPGR